MAAGPTADSSATRLPELRRRLRVATRFLMLGLVFSGATAVAIPSEIALAGAILGSDMSAGGMLPAFMVRWAVELRSGIGAAQEVAPFVFYGTDWLAFGHFVIAGAFIGALRDPVRNRWLYKFGMAACAAVPVWAAIFGSVRGIPWWWRLVDASFGFFGFIPAYLCHHWAAEAEELLNQSRSRVDAGGVPEK
jgi:hypothetical protein